MAAAINLMFCSISLNESAPEPFTAVADMHRAHFNTAAVPGYPTYRPFKMTFGFCANGTPVTRRLNL